MNVALNFKRVLVRSLSAAAALSLAGGCGGPDPKPFDPVSLQRLAREHATQNLTPRLDPLPLELDKTFLVKRDQNSSTPTSQPTTAQSIGPSIRMSLRELIQLAVANSLQVKVANYQPAIDEARVQEAEARFDPTAFTNLNYQTQWLLSPSANAPTANNNFFETMVYQTGFKQNLANGAQIQLQYQLQRVFSTNSAFGAAPGSLSGRWESDLSLQVTQPLLQNAGTAVNQARIVVARNTQRVTLLDSRLQLEKTLGEIEEAYWQLVQAEAELAIQEQLYAQTVATSVHLQKRRDVDTTPVSLGQANAALRSRAVTLIDARYRLKLLSNEIKARVNDPRLPASGNVTILAEDRPIQAPIRFDLAEQIEAGLTNRAELAQQVIRIDSATVVQSAAKNNLLPSLNLVGSIGTKGAGINPEGAWRSQFEDWNFGEYAIGFQLEVPIGNREARAIYRRTALSRLQAIDQYRDLIERISVEIRNAHDNVMSSWQKMVAAREALFAADNALHQIQIEEDSGTVRLDENFVNRKLNAQEVLAQARRTDAQSVADYNTGIATLERSKGTLLKYDNVVMRQEPLQIGAAGEGFPVNRKQE
jgi:outer membrane protein TolC